MGAYILYTHILLCRQPCQHGDEVNRSEYMKAYCLANKERQAARAKAWNETNKEKVKERRKAYRDANKEKIAKRSKEYYEANKNRLVSLHKTWAEENKEKMASYSKKHYEVNKEKISANYIKNKEKFDAYKKNYRELNKEKVVSGQKNWYEANKENKLEKVKQYRVLNPGKVAANNKARKYAKLKATPKWANLQIIKLYYEIAARVTKETNENYHVDHIIPIQGKLVSGLHVENNFQLLTAYENISKSNKVLV